MTYSKVKPLLSVSTDHCQPKFFLLQSLVEEAFNLQPQSRLILNPDYQCALYPEDSMRNFLDAEMIEASLLFRKLIWLWDPKSSAAESAQLDAICIRFRSN